ncbi:hypothetical protein, partial [Candidatus Magnetaquicoccus inordinatus]|uniref:hypothetical protein n=1 Tax=Candidatus Magnetaquicoccus inordinatus TaxID=2496818 RepID=UPI00102D253C
MKFWHSLANRLLIGIIGAGMAVLLALALLAMEAVQIHREAMEDHFFMNFLNILLETRRYEKGYFQFHKKNDWENALNYLDQVDRQLRFERQAFLDRADGNAIYANLSVLVAEYREKLLLAPRQLEQDPKQIHDVELLLHQIGRQLLAIGEQLASDTKNDVTRAMQHTHKLILLFSALLLMLLLASTLFVWLRVRNPLLQLQHILQLGAHSALNQTPHLTTTDPEWRALSASLKRWYQTCIKEKNEQSAADLHLLYTLLLPISKTVAQPMANLSTTCQILQEEESGYSSMQRNSLLLQLRELADQGNRIATTIQQHIVYCAQPFIAINLNQLLRNLFAHTLHHPSLAEWRLQLDTELFIHGNQALLEQMLIALLQHTGHRSPPSDLLLLSLSRQSVEQWRAETSETEISSLNWLPPGCPDLISLTLPLASDLKTLEHLPASGERALFLPQTEDNP